MNIFGIRGNVEFGLAHMKIELVLGNSFWFVILYIVISKLLIIRGYFPQNQQKKDTLFAIHFRHDFKFSTAFSFAFCVTAKVKAY